MAKLAEMQQATDSWPTFEEAAAQLQTSERTMWRHASAGRIEVRKRQRAGRKPENIVNPADIARLLPQPHIMLAEAPDGAEARTLVRHTGRAPSWEAALAHIATILTAGKTQGAIDTVSIREKLWLTLDEAQSYSGLGRHTLLDLCREGRIKAFKERGWRIRRASLERFEG